MLYLFNVNVFFCEVKMLVFCNVQTTNLTFVGQNESIQIVITLRISI